MKKVLCAMMLFAAAILCLHQNVFAAEGATVTVNGDTLQAGSDAWKVTLDISGDTKITNGKIRVTYDSSQLKLVSTEAGSMMNGVLTDINDPISGNKSEGEAVFVFASSTELDTNGTLFEMTFQVQDSVKDGDSVTVSAKTEELQSNNNGNNNGGNDSSTEPQTETASNNGNNGNGSGSDNQGGSGIQTEAPSGNSNTSGGSSTFGGTSSGSSSTAGTQSGSSTVTSAKTGDNTNVLRPLIIAVIALIVLIGGYVWSRKKKK